MGSARGRFFINDLYIVRPLELDSRARNATSTITPRTVPLAQLETIIC